MVPPDIRKQRKAAAGRRRRLVFHSDGRPWDSAFIAHVGATQVDACTYSLIHQFNFCRGYATRVGQLQDAQLALDAQGRDLLQVYVDFCRAQNIEAFWAMRMNDSHEAGNYRSALQKRYLNRFKQDHPECLLGSDTQRPPYGAWTSVDYAHPRVREQVFLLVEEVCRNYEIDGIFLDFFRHPAILSSVAWGGEASGEERAMVTALLQRIRRMADEVGAARGRPILVAVRTPDCPDYCRAIGMDVARWMSEDLIDIWTVACYFRLRSWAESVRDGHAHGVQVWASLQESRMPGQLPPRSRAVDAADALDPSVAAVRNSPESFRAQAMEAWHEGVDALFLFNCFWKPGDVHHGLLQELGAPASLAGCDKLYCPDVLDRTMPFAPNGWMARGNRFYTRPWSVSPEHPLPVTGSRSVVVEMSVYDDLPAAMRRGLNPNVELAVQVHNLVGPDEADLDRMIITVNGTTVPGRVDASRVWVVCHPGPNVIGGSTRIELALPPDCASTLIVHDVHVRVTYLARIIHEST